MDFMRRNARWIALAALLAILTPFIAQAFNALFAIDAFLVAVILLVGIVLAIVFLTRSQNDED